MSKTEPISPEAMAEIRLERNQKLSDCDWTQLPDSPADKAAWATYRQQLREVPDTVTDPNNIDWPVPPS